jgi:hypothetical protein
LTDGPRVVEGDAEGGADSAAVSVCAVVPREVVGAVLQRKG